MRLCAEGLLCIYITVTIKEIDYDSNQEIYGGSHRFARKFAASQRKSGVGNALISVSIAKYVKSV